MNAIFVLVVVAFTGAGGSAYVRDFTSAAACSAAEASARVAARNADPIFPGSAYVVRSCERVDPESQP